MINSETLMAAAIWANTGDDVWAPGVRINTLGFVTQCCHETGWFGSAMMNAHHNYAGISCTKGWIRRGGKCFTSKTWEHIDDQDQTVVKGFRSYPSLKDFLADYSGIIQRGYPLAAESVDCVWLYLAGLVHGKGGRRWATDPLYFEKLVRMAVKLAPSLVGNRWGTTWRQTLERSLTAAVERGFPEPGMEGIVEEVLGNV